jgi:hypothetical protein
MFAKLSLFCLRCNVRVNYAEEVILYQAQSDIRLI